MVGFLARNLLLPLHEAILGRPTLRMAAELEASQWLSPADLRTLQARKLAGLLTHAATNVPYYRDRFVEAGVQPGTATLDPFAALGRLPLLSRGDARQHARRLGWLGCPGGLFPCDTGGSSGESLRFQVCRRRQAADQAARIRTHRWFGVHFGDRELYLWGSPIELSRTDRVKRWRDRVFNHRLLSAFDMSPARLDGYLDVLDLYRPRCLFGYPSSLALLAEHGIARGRPGNLPSLRAVFVTGEVCDPQTRTLLEDYFSAPVADCYGARDAGFIAHQCPHGGLHIGSEHVVVEIIRDGAPVPVGEPGEIVVTHLEAWGMPFIRYRTGDWGRVLPGRCACGRGLPLMGKVEGRVTDFIRLPDGTARHALSVIYPLRAREDVRRFRVVQNADYSLEVEVEPNDGVVDRHAIIREVGRAVGAGLPVHVRQVDRVGLAASGKYRYVTSEVKNPTLVDPPGDAERKEPLDDSLATAAGARA